MIRSGRLLQVTGGILLLLVTEWLLPDASAPAWQRPYAVSSSAAVGGFTNADVTQWSNTILSRPLLSASRRPVQENAAAVSDTLPRLSAIVVIGGTRHAIFAAPGEKPQLVSEGSEIGVYQVKTVAPDKVELTGPDGPVALRPQFLTAAPAAPARPQ